ncbi:MAG: HAD family hydrolase [Pseudomonadota bacterium]
MTKIAGIVFDKDGTLFDFQETWGAWAGAFLSDLARGDRLHAARLGKAVGYDVETGTFRPSSPVVAGTPSEIAQALLEQLPGANPQALISRINVSAASAPLVPAVPLQPLLGGFRAQGIKLGVATNDAEAPARAHLEAAGIADLFDFISGFDSGFGAKPGCGMLDGFCARFDLSPGHVIMVGDSRHDLVAGRTAGMLTVGVLTGLSSRGDLADVADAILPDVGGLPGLLAGVDLAESVV